MSNLLVQNIKHTNNTSAQTIDSSGRTTAVLNNDTTYRSDGGAVTQNMVQGVAKAWFNNDAGESPRDSLNVSGITDNQTGDDSYAYINNMANDDYASITAGWRDHDAYHACAENLISTSANRCRSFTRDTNTLVDSGYKAVAVHGDLA